MRFRVVFVLVVAAITTASACTARVSTASNGAQGDGDTINASISGDGRFVIFTSASSNLVPGDTNDTLDVFVFDRNTNQTSRVSIASDGSQGDGPSLHPSISANGRYVAFDSVATNLTPGGAEDAVNNFDVFVHDRTTGTTSLVSTKVWSFGGEIHVFNGGTSPSISADGRYVAFEAGQKELDVLDSNGISDIAIADLSTGALDRLPATPSGGSANLGTGFPSISADGSSVAFYSGSTNLVPGDTNAAADIFVYDRATRTNSLISVASDGTQANNSLSPRSSMSADGRFVVFDSSASNLVAGDTNGSDDIFVRDRQTGTTTRASVASNGGQLSGNSIVPSISSSGRYVAFTSTANPDPIDTNGFSDVYVRDRQTGTTSLVSVAPNGVATNGPSGFFDLSDDVSAQHSISDDGKYVAFRSSATNLVGNDTNNVADVFVRFRG